jgi:hypothetical protein
MAWTCRRSATGNGESYNPFLSDFDCPISTRLAGHALLYSCRVLIYAYRHECGIFQQGGAGIPACPDSRRAGRNACATLSNLNPTPARNGGVAPVLRCRCIHTEHRAVDGHGKTLVHVRREKAAVNVLHHRHKAGGIVTCAKSFSDISRKSSAKSGSQDINHSGETAPAPVRQAG